MIWTWLNPSTRPSMHQLQARARAVRELLHELRTLPDIPARRALLRAHGHTVGEYLAERNAVGAPRGAQPYIGATEGGLLHEVFALCELPAPRAPED